MKNRIDLHPESKTATLHVTSKTHGSFQVLIDIEDVGLIEKHTWHVRKLKNHTYFATNISDTSTKWTTFQLHRLLTNAPDDMDIDHINHQYLDCRKSQLRVCSRSENAQNMRKQQRETSSCFKGVYLFKRDNKWMARIGLNGRDKYLGWYTSEIEAALAYDHAAIKYYGDYALLNFPDAVAA